MRMEPQPLIGPDSPFLYGPSCPLLGKRLRIRIYNFSQGFIICDLVSEIRYDSRSQFLSNHHTYVHIIDYISSSLLVPLYRVAIAGTSPPDATQDTIMVGGTTGPNTGHPDSLDFKSQYMISA